MLNKNLILGLCILILLTSVSAITTYEETSSVSRIVGESPNEMLRQMQRDSLNLDHATYFSYETFGNEKETLLEKQFKSNLNSEVEVWNVEDVETAVNEFENNELFIIEARGGVDPLYAEFGSALFGNEEFYPRNVRDWQRTFEETNPLFIFETPYGGVYLPKEDTFISRLVRDTTLIAPSSFNSPQFTKSLLCNLADDKTIGQVFKEARNFHYNGGSKSKGDNLIGLVLQSYRLYGNPLQKINMNWDTDDLDSIKDLCKNHLENLDDGIEFLEQVGDYSKFRKHLVFEIIDYDVIEEGEFELIHTDSTFQNLEYGELVLPLAIRTTHFPTNTLITNFGVEAATNTMDFRAEKLPSYENELVDRTCYEEASEHEVEFENIYTSDTQDFVARISPVKVRDCEEGVFRLYRRIEYYVDYIPLSPILIKEVDAPLVSAINSMLNVDIEIMELIDESVEGTLAIFKEGNTKVWEEDINSNVKNYRAQFKVSDIEGLNKYWVEFINEAGTQNLKEFSTYTTLLDPQVRIPKSVGSEVSITLDLFSYSRDDFDLSSKYYLSKNLEVISQGNFEKVIQRGSNEHVLDFENLRKEDQSYTLTLELDYLGEKKSGSYLLNTNNVPLVYVETKPVYYAGEDIVIRYKALDADADELSINLDDNRFVKRGSAFVWSDGEVGEYEVELSVSDGLSEISKSLIIKVEDRIELPNTVYGFSDGDYSKYLEFEDAGSKTVYLKIPKTAIIEEAKLEVRGENA